jgi:exosortase
MSTLQKRILMFAALVILPVLAGAVPFLELASFAWHTGEQSYILLVPAVSAVLIYFNRDRAFVELGTNQGGSRFLTLIPGAVFIALAYLLESGSELRLASMAIGLILFWSAAFYVCFGREALRRSTFELGMLVWIIPIPAAAIDWITVALQKASADLVDVMFQVTRVPVLRSGFFFYLPGQAIEVAKECSGIRSTLALLFLTLILAHESLHGTWRRIVLVLCALAVVVIKNGIRIVSLTLLAIYVDPSFLTGPLHHQGGVVFFLIGLAILLPIISLLRRGDKPAGSDLQTKAAGA